MSLGLDQNQVDFESSRVRVTDQILSFSLGNVSVNNLTGENGNPLYPFMFEFERNASVGLRYGERGSSFDFYFASIFAQQNPEKVTTSFKMTCAFSGTIHW